MSSVIGIISEFADAPEKKAGVRISGGLTVAVLCFDGVLFPLLTLINMVEMVLLFAWLQAAQIWFIGTKRVSKNTTYAKSVHINLARIQFLTYPAPGVPNLV